MTTHRVYSSKAELYARHRWDYAPEAVSLVLERAGVNAQTRAADVGAGTGIFTRHLVGRAGQVLALEPNPPMRLIARRDLPAGCLVAAGAAEALPLPQGSLDLLTVAQAIHWFEAGAAKAEFRRVLRDGGWLAVLRNYGADARLNEALAAFHTAEFGVDTHGSGAPSGGLPVESYYAAGRWERHTFPLRCEQTWEAFLGALLSASYAPDLQHPLYPRYEAAAREVFERFAVGGSLETQAVTELYIGQMA